MSLKRILNDEPPPSLPARHTNAGPSRASGPDHPYADISPVPRPAAVSPPHTRAHHHHSQSPLADQPPPRRGYEYQPAPYPGAGGWDPYSDNYVQGDIFPLGPGGSYYPQRERETFPSGPSDSHPDSAGAYYRDTENDHASKRRRRAMDDDSDYTPPASKRPGLRRNPPRSKAPRPGSPQADHGEAFHEYHPTEEERRLASSDLSDCEEVWIGELSDYIMETHKRQRQVESWFEASVLERNSTTAVMLSKHYITRIARIPPPPPSPIPPSASVDEELLSTLHASPRGTVPVDFKRDPEYDVRGRPVNAAAEDAARELEDSLLGVSSKGKRKDVLKRSADGALSDVSSDLEVPTPVSRTEKPAAKKRKMDKDATAIADELERAVEDLSVSPIKAATSKTKGKGKSSQLREPSVDSTATATLTPKGRKKAMGKKKFDALVVDQSGQASTAGSINGDATPSASRPASPALTAASTLVYELDEVVPPLKRAKKMDENGMAKRLKSLEEAQRKVWTNIARRDITKVYKYSALGYQGRQSQLKRLAMLASMQARRPFTKTAKASKDVQAKAKRLMREMLVFWKKNEREERDVRKREQKEAIDRAKIEEEKREAARQARKLEFLISQTELYSHFVGNKLKTAEVQGDSAESSAPPPGADLAEVDPSTLQDIDFDDGKSALFLFPLKAIALAKQRAQQFDARAALERKTNEALKLAKAQAHVHDDDTAGSSDPSVPLVDLDSDELNFQNPTSLSGPLTIKQPTMLMAQLKEYQLKGLNWLATLYEQGINGILADEMGLGKTVQSISLIAYLAEVHDIWGPFLVVAPASTLHNWQQEITRFVPSLKALPYWGNVKDRTTLRKFWSKKEISYNKDAPFHVLITSYQLVTQDQQYFQRVKWQYMILDEAQNIKNASSVRWKTLLGFQCRNRLLLTGTPIQNSMQELWALLHFIMPSLFDSHDEFNEWFSKDIENAAENKGSKLNEHQLRRLHMILKPFMLRRVKRHVQNELSEKIEIDIYVDLSSRQRALYRALLANVSVADLLEKAANIGDADSARSLMNLVMQFRKSTDHDVASPAFAFLRLLDATPSDVHSLHVSSFLRRRLMELEEENRMIERSTILRDTSFSTSDISLPQYSLTGDRVQCHPHLSNISLAAWKESCLCRPGLKWFVPAVVAPPITMTCTDRTFIEHQTHILDAPVESITIYGISPELQESPEACNMYNELVPMIPARGLISSSSPDQLPRPRMQIPEAKRLIYDSAKLARLDTLLQELKAGDHRVLVYFQMTRMMDLMEEYLIYRQYKYLRLDGSSKLEDRRDMVMDWQTRPDIFVFLLSTRAGGLGINLTAADTVIFYDHDWNPSNDAQAMDRAHRLGQTRQVTVYRLITKGTIDERIIQLARVKKDVQDIVVGNKNFTDVTKPSEIVQLLLNDDQLAGIDNNNVSGLSSKKSGKRPAGSSETNGDTVRDLWNDEGDDFFGHAVNSAATVERGIEGDAAPAPTRGKKRKAGANGVSRARKAGGKQSTKKKVEAGNDVGSGMDAE
ncbi:hypothetical protein ID866_594 [Astraeus odoratus]|nr:hypothetical protein ID866_594 [Astraeus odoratus]